MYCTLNQIEKLFGPATNWLHKLIRRCNILSNEVVMPFYSQWMWFKPDNKFQKRLGESIYAVCISPSGYLILAGGTMIVLLIRAKFLVCSENLGSSGSVKVWDANSGKLEDELYIGSTILHITWVELRSHHDTFFVASEDGSICLYWHQSLSYFATLQTHLPFKVVLPLLSPKCVTYPWQRRSIEGHSIARWRLRFQVQSKTSTTSMICLLLLEAAILLSAS